MWETFRPPENLESGELFSKERVIAHRGASEHGPENTIRAFSKAIEMGFTSIELDVWKLKGGKLAVMHDATVSRTTNGKGRIDELTENDLGFLKIKDSDGKITEERIPLLGDVLDAVKRRARVVIELKGPNTAKSVSDLIDVYINEKGWLPSDFVVTSFDYKQLLEFQKFNPMVQLGLSVRKYKAFLNNIFKANINKYTEGLNAKIICLSKDVVSKRVVDQIHQAGAQVWVYTVNTPDAAVELKSMGVDMVFSDTPGKISQP